MTWLIDWWLTDWLCKSTLLFISHLLYAFCKMHHGFMQFLLFSTLSTGRIHKAWWLGCVVRPKVHVETYVVRRSDRVIGAPKFKHKFGTDCICCAVRTFGWTDGGNGPGGEAPDLGHSPESASRTHNNPVDTFHGRGRPTWRSRCHHDWRKTAVLRQLHVSQEHLWCVWICVEIVWTWTWRVTKER